jgi:regulator of extracellular matrix RemA (YlzA/DUF370 family)
MEFFSRMFLCCTQSRRVRRTEEDKNIGKIEVEGEETASAELSQPQIVDKINKNSSPIKPILKDKDDELLIDEKFIRQEEKGMITFSKNGIISFIEKISNEDLYNWIPLYNKDNLVLHYQNGVLFSIKLVNVVKYPFAWKDLLCNAKECNKGQC